MAEWTDLPVLDGAQLQLLKDETDEAIAEAFIEQYLVMLPVRAAKILKRLDGESLEPAIDAVTSLRVSSAMAGALRLEGYCSELERALTREHRPASSAVKAVLFANIRLVVSDAANQGHLSPCAQGPADG